jgi:hypothetical protein
MNILLLNDSYFGKTLDRPDLTILRVGPGPGNDIVINPESQDLSKVIQKAGFDPDLVFQVDSIDGRVFFYGLESIEAPRVFYAVDSPINEFWQKDWAHNFDFIFVDQRATADRFRDAGIDWVEWLPLAADSEVFYSSTNDHEREYDVLFVGTVDPERRPKRSAILYRLRQIADVKVVDGGGVRGVKSSDVADLYRNAKIVVNEMLFDGINLRTFEAMACGAVVLTEENRGEKDLFEDLPILETFNGKTLETSVENLLTDTGRRKSMSRDGTQLVRDVHTIQHRANHVLRRFETVRIRDGRYTNASSIRAEWARLQAALKWQNLAKVGNAAMARLSSRIESLSRFEQATLLEAGGHADKAYELLMKAHEANEHDERIPIALAAMAIEKGENALGEEILGITNATASDMHISLGNRLLAEGIDLTPGINRMLGPVTEWTALEHFMRAHSLDEDSLAAIQGMDRILDEHHSGEFTLPLWQRWHARHPRDTEAIRLFLMRTRNSYFRSRPVGNEGRGIGRPFETASQRSTDRTQSSVRPTRSGS